MSFLDKLKAALTLPQVPAHEFRTHPRRDELIHLFAEGGADVSYFRKQTNKLFPDMEFVFYDCGGKDNVLHTYSTIATLTHKATCLYVVDRDLDPYISPFISDPAIFETSRYSVEWYAIPPSPIERFCKSFFTEHSISGYGSESSLRFEAVLDQFSRYALPYVAYAIAARREGHKVRFSDVRVKDLVEIDAELQLQRRRNGRGKWTKDSSGGQPHIIKYRKLSQTIRMLRSIDSDFWLRGHFVMELMVKYISQLFKLTGSSLKGHSGYTELRQHMGQHNERTLFQILIDDAPVIQDFEEYARRIIAPTGPMSEPS